MIVSVPCVPVKVMGVVGVAAISCVALMVVPAMVSELTPYTGEASWNVPLSTSPVSAALVPMKVPAGPKLDSRTLPSEPVTAPSLRPVTAGTPTMVTVSVVVAWSPSLS